jgi:hypothetical protein
MTKAKKKRGRPRRDIWVEIVRSLTAEDIELLNTTKNRGGKPAHSDNQSLVEGAADAQRQGKTRRAFVTEWLKLKHGRAPEPDEVCATERRMDRLRKKFSLRI